MNYALYLSIFHSIRHMTYDIKVAIIIMKLLRKYCMAIIKLCPP